MSKVKIILCCLIGLSVAGVGFGLVSYLRLREEPQALLSILPENKDVCLSRIHHVATRDGVKEWTLDAESAEYDKGEKKTVFKDILATFFLEDGKTVSLNSQEGILLTDTQDMEIWGNVVAQSGSYHLSTEKLLYEHKTKTISTETPVAIKGNGMKISGNSMTFNLQTEQVVVSGSVKAVLESLTL